MYGFLSRTLGHYQLAIKCMRNVRKEGLDKSIGDCQDVHEKRVFKEYDLWCYMDLNYSFNRSTCACTVTQADIWTISDGLLIAWKKSLTNNIVE